MRILLSTSEDDFIRHENGKTWAEKKSRFQAKLESGGHFAKYFNVMNGYDGKWVEVDMKYLFTQSFNALLDNNGVYDVQQNFVKSVDISPFNTLEEWIGAVQNRYDVDWPGTKAETLMSFWKTRII